MVHDTSAATPKGQPGAPGQSAVITADEVFRIIRERLADILEIDESKVTIEAGFADDLGADSLALIELVEALEAELEGRVPGFRIEDEDLAELRTVRDAVDYVVDRVGG